MAQRMPGKIYCGRQSTRGARDKLSILLPMTLPQAHHCSEPLKIMQYNIAKKREVMDSLLNDKDTQQYTLLLIQELCRTHKNKIPLLHHSWTALEPTHHSETLPRAAIYVNNKRYPWPQLNKSRYLIPTSSLSPYPPNHLFRNLP